MAYLEYQLPQSSHQWFVNDSVQKKRWLVKKTLNIASQKDLEEQIHDLRVKLERLVLGGQEMTSECVIEISMELDLKIIEYMNNHDRDRQ